MESIDATDTVTNSILSTQSTITSGEAVPLQVMATYPRQQSLNQGFPSIRSSKESISKTDTAESMPQRLTQQELAQRIEEFASPAEIAAFIMDLNHHLEAENQRLQINNASLRAEKTSNYHLEADNQRLQISNDDLRAEKASMRLQISDLSNKLIQYQKPGTTFTCFSKLPAELRIRIWNLAVPPPRLVHLQALKTPDTYLFHTETAYPSVVHACKEAREEILRIHPLCPDSQSNAMPGFFNHFHDVLYIHWGDYSHIRQWDGSNFPANLAGFDPLKLRILAIDSTIWDYYNQVLIYELFMFPLLEELILIHSQWSDPYGTHPYGSVMPTGKWKLIDQSCYEDVMRFISLDDIDPYTSGEYKCDAENSFKKELDSGEFVKQENHWARPREETKGQQKNMWLAEGKAPPRIRMMRMVRDSESTLKLDFNGPQEEE